MMQRHELLRTARKAKGYSLLRFGVLSGIDPGHLSRIENDKASPTVEQIFKFRDLLDLDVDVWAPSVGNPAANQPTAAAGAR